MTEPHGEADVSSSARIPADIEREDPILGPLTARQTVWLGAGALVLYAGYWASRAWMAPLAYLALVTPVAGVLIGLALGRREGVPLDRFALAAVAHARAPKRMVHAPEGVPELPGFLDRALARQAGPVPAPANLPCQGVTDTGLLDLGPEGVAAVAVCSTVNFELRNGAEQQALVGGFGRWLNALTGPTQILIRTRPMDLGPAVERLRAAAPALPHPALTAAANAHADFLVALGQQSEVLARQVLVVAREPRTAQAAGSRAAQRIAEATQTLAMADIDAQPMTGVEAAEVVHAACNPEPPTRHDTEREPC